MALPDLNLLVALDVLLEEQSVARAARRLRLSASAISRTLARLRDATGDPLLVRAGRRLVPTPHALTLREGARRIVLEAGAVLSPAPRYGPDRYTRAFTLRTSDGFVETFGPALVARVEREAPGVRLHFVQKPDKESTSLREGAVDLETGLIERTTSPELRSIALFRDRWVGVARKGHPLSRGPMTAERFTGARHVVVARPGQERSPVDASLAALGMERQVAITVGGFGIAIGLVRATDLVTCVPERHSGRLRDGLHTFELPVATPDFAVSLLWHPRMDADPAHRWLRGCVRDACADSPDAGRQTLKRHRRPGSAAR